MRDLKAAVIWALQHGPLDDDQLGEVLGTSRQSARGAALRMREAGVVTRAKPAGGKWVTSLAGDRMEPAAPGQERPSGAADPVILDASAAVDALTAIYAFTRGSRPERGSQC